MKPKSSILRASLLISATVLLLNSCLYKEPVFTEGFGKVEDRFAGVWVAKVEGDDARANQFVVCAPIDEERYLLHHPARESNSFYYEARPLVRREGTLFQLRILATFDGGIPEPDADVFTLIWIQPKSEGRVLVRSLEGGAILEDRPPAEVRQILESPDTDWGELFGDGMEYRRLDSDD